MQAKIYLLIRLPRHLIHVVSQVDGGDCVHVEGPGAAPRPAEPGPLPDDRRGDRGQEEAEGGDAGEAATASLVERPGRNFHLIDASVLRCPSISTRLIRIHWCRTAMINIIINASKVA